MLCKELKILNIFPAQWSRQISTISTERQKHQSSKGSMAVNPPAMWELSQPCPFQTNTWSMAYLPAQRRPLTDYLSGRSLILSLNSFLDTKRLSLVTGIFHKKLSLGRRKLNNYLFPFKRKKDNKPPRIVLKIWSPGSSKRKKYCTITESQPLNSWGVVPPTPFQTPQSEGPQPLPAWGRRAPKAHGPAWGHAPSLHIVDCRQHQGRSNPRYIKSTHTLF